MATTTPNYGLTLPASNEKISISVINHNMEIIDEAIGGNMMFTVPVSASSNVSVAIADERITADHVVLETSYGKYEDITWVTANGSITISCSRGIPAMTITLYLPGGEE